MVAIVSGNSLGLSLSSLATLGQSAVTGTATQGRNGEGAYVNAATGNLVLQDTDLTQPERGNQSIDSVRTYNSLGSTGADNWTKGFDLQSLALTAGTVNTAGSIVTRTDSDGAKAAYAYNATTGLYVATNGGGAFDTIAYNATTHVYTRTDGSTQMVESYTSAGVLTSLTDSDGNVVTVTHNAAGLVSSVMDPAGATRTYYDYDTNNRLTQIHTVDTASLNSTWVRYAYDTSGRLTTVTVDLSPADNAVTDNNTYVTTYSYVGATADIASVTQKDGTSLTFTYDASFRVASVTDQLGNKTTFAYDTTNRNTTVTDPNNAATVYHYDTLGQLASVTAPTTGTSTATTSYTYNANGDVTQVTDGAGRTVTMAYDANGNQTQQQDAAGNTVTRVYDALNHLVTETAYVVPDPDGAGAGTASVPMTTRYVYDPAGQHLLRFVLTPEGRVTEYRYDAVGNRTSTIQYGSAVYALTGMATTAAPTLAQMTAWTPTLDLTRTTRTDVAYDVWGQPTASTAWTKIDATGAGVVDGTQSVTHYTYSQFGRLLNTISPLAGSTSYTYDGLGRVLTSVNAAGVTTTTTYDDVHNKTTVTYANGLVVTSAYDQAGRLMSVTQGTSTTPNLGTTQYAYDADGNLRMVTDPDGIKHYMLYDAGGRKIADIDANGSMVESVYNNADQVVETIRYANAMSAAVLATLVDANGKPTTVAIATLRPSGQANTSWTLYDAAGRVSRQVDAMGYVTETRYDGASRVTDVIRYAAATATVITPASLPTDIVVTANAALDHHTRALYDNDGRVVGSLDGAGYLTENVYDALGNLVHTIAYATVSPSAYWATGTLAQLRPAADATHDIHAWNYYDDQNRLVGAVDGEGYLTEYGYDADGNQTRTLRYATKALVAPTAITANTTLAQLRPAPGALDHTTTASYNTLDQVVSRTDEYGTITQYTYDNVGHLLSTVSAAGGSDARTVTETYDVQGRVTGVLNGRGSAALAALGQPAAPSAVATIWATYGTTYTYDADGLRTSMTDGAGNKTLYFYDADGHQTFAVNALGEVTETRYNALNLVSATIQYGTRISTTGLTGGPNSQVTGLVAAIANANIDSSVSNVYDARNELTQQTDASNIASSKTYTAFGDVASTTTGLGSGATVVGSTTYDSRGLVMATTADIGGIASSTTVVRDAFGRATSMNANGNVTTTTYDRLGRAVQATDGMTTGKATTYTTYDAFDRVLTTVDGNTRTTTYTWNDAQLTMAMSEPSGATVVTTYDRHGETISVRNEDGIATTTQYDLDGHVAHTIVDSDSGGLALDTHTDYDTAGRVYDTVDANNIKTVYTYDAANRVLTRTVDPTGLALVTRYSYDAKGEVLTQTDPDGIVTKMTYDRKGEVLTRTVDPTGLALTTTYSYDGRGNILTTTDPSGTVTTYVYDKLGRRSSMTVDSTMGGLALVTNYAYDKAGNLAQVTDPTGAVTRYVYDADNRVHYTLDAENGLTETDYDGDGHVAKQVVYATRQTTMTTSVAPNGTVTNTMGAITTSAADEVTQTAYDLNGRKTLVQVDPTGLNLKTQYAYDNAGNVTRVIDPDGNVTLIGYDAANRAIYSLDGAKVLTQTTYLKTGQPQVITRYAGSPTNVVTTVAANGSVTSTFNGFSQSALDMVTLNAYDAVGRKVSSTANPAALALRTTYDYDANGNITRTTDPAGNVTRYVYDNANRLRYKLDPLNRLTETDYDGAGRVVAQVVYGDPQTAITTTQLTNGLLTNTFTAITPDVALDRVTRYAYDTAGRLVYTIDPVGNVTESQLDADGHVVVQRHYVTPIDLPTAGSADGKTITANGNTAAVTMASYPAINTAHTYRVTVVMRQLSGAGSVSIGVRSLDANGNLLSNPWGGTVGNTNSYCSAINVALTPDMGWQTFTGTITGTYTPTSTGPNPVTAFIAGTTKASPLVLYNGSSTNGDPGRDVEIDSIELYDVTAGAVVNANSTMASGMTGYVVAAGTGQASANANGALSAAMIKSLLRVNNTADQITRYAYDKDGRQIFAVDATGGTTETDYDGAGNVVNRTTFGSPIDLPTAGSTDGKTVTVNGTTAKLTGAAYYAINTAHTYTVTVRARQVSGTGLFYAGVITKDASGNVIANSVAPGGTYAYCAASGVTLTPEMGWQTFSGTITGTYTPAANTTNTGTAFLAGSATASPLVLYNYGVSANGDPGRDVEIDSITLYDNTAGTTVNIDPSLVNGAASVVVANGVVDTAPSTIDAPLTAAQILARLRVNPATDRTTRYAYDAADRPVLTVDATGQVTETTYDADGNVAATRAYAATIAVPTDHTAALSAASIRSALAANTAADRVTRNVYDADARVIYTVGAQGLVTNYVYDNFGNVTSQTTYGTPIDTSTLAVAITPTDVTSRLSPQPAVDRTTRNVYDSLGRLTLTVDPAGQATQTTYDADGNVVQTRQLATPVPSGPALQVNYVASTNNSAYTNLGTFLHGDVVTATVRFKAPAGQSGAIFLGNTNDYVDQTNSTVVGNGGWQTLSVHLTVSEASEPLYLYMYSDATTHNAIQYDDVVVGSTLRGVVKQDSFATLVTGAGVGQWQISGTMQQVFNTPANAGSDTALAAFVNATIDNTRDRATRDFYDADGRQVYEVDARGYVTESRYFTNHTQTIRYAIAPALGASPTTASIATALTGIANQVTDQFFDADGHPTDLVNAAGITSRDVFDGLGRVVTHIDALGRPEQTTTAYTYDAAGRVLTQTVAQGSAAAATTVNTYDAFGELLTQLSPEGYALLNVDNAWTQATRPLLLGAGKGATAAGLSAAQRNQLAALYTAQHAYDLDGRETTTSNGTGASTTTTYDAFGDAVKVVDPLGNAGYFYFDTLGRVTLQIDPVGNATETIYTNGFTDKVASVRRYATQVATGTLTTSARPTLAQTASDAVTSYTYDTLGRVLTTTDGAGTESVAYRAAVGSAMNVFDKVVTNKVGGSTTYLYDQDGDELSETLPVTQYGTPGGILVSNTYLYDGYGNRIQSIEGVNLATGQLLPEARTTLYRYDAMGRVVYRIGTTYTAADGTSVTPVDFTNYDALGRVIETRTNASWTGSAATGGVRALNYYDAAGNTVMTIAADGAVVGQTFTPTGKVFKSSAYATPIATATFNALVAGGTPPTVVADNANDRVTTSVYDALDRVVETDLDNVVHWEQSADPTAPVILTLAGAQSGSEPMSKAVYDANGNVVQQIDGRGNSTYNYYDAAGRKTLSIDAGGFATAWDYNSVGGSAVPNAFDTPIRQVQYSTALAATAYARQGDTSVANANLRTPAALRATLDAIVAAAGNPNRVTTYTLDTAGRVTQKTIASVVYSAVTQGSGSTFSTSSGTAASVTTTTYDGLGDILSQQQGAGDTTTYVYDALGRVVEQRDASFTGIVDTSGTAGSVTPVTDTEYDALGNVHRTIQRGTNGASEADDRITLSVYDANGNLTQQTDANGNVTTYAYDALGRMARSTVLGVLDASGGHTDEAKTYTYDAMGRQVTQTDIGTGQIQFTKYDAFGEIVNKGMGSVASGTTPVYQEYTQYNVMGKVQRSNSGDGVSKIYLYDLNGNTTRQITSTSVDLTGVSIVAAATNTALQHTFSVYDSRNNLVRTVEPDISYQQDQVSSQAAYSEQLTNLYGAISVGNSAGGTYTAGSVDPNGYGYTQVGGESGSSAMPGASTAGVWNTSAPSPTPSTSAAAMPTLYAFPLTWSGTGNVTSMVLPSTWSSALNYRIINTSSGTVLSTPVPGGTGTVATSPSGVSMAIQASSADMGWTTVATLNNWYQASKPGEPGSSGHSSTVVLPCIVSGLAGVSVDAYTNYGTPSQANSSITALGSSEYKVTNPGSPVTLIWHDASGIRLGAVATWPGGVLTLSQIPLAQVWTPANQRMPVFSSSVTATSGNTTLYYRIVGSGSDWGQVTLSGNTADLTGLAANQNYEYILSSNRGEFYGTLTTGGAGQMSLPQTQMSGVTAPPGFAMLSQPLVGYNPQIAFDVAGSLAAVNVAPPGGYVMDLNLNGTTVEVPLSGTSANFDPHSFGINLSRYAHTGVSYYYNVFAVQAGGARQFVGQGSGTMTLGGSDFTQQNYGSGTYQPTAFLTLPSSTALTGTLNVGGINIGVNSGDWRIHRTTDSASNPVLAIDLSQFLSQTGISISYSAGDAVFSGSYSVASNGAVTCNGVSSQVRQPLVPISIAGAAALSVLRVGPIGGPLVDVPPTLVSTSGSTFTWDASTQAGQGIKQFYYEARNAGGTLVGMGYGTMTLAANGTLTYSMDTPLLKPSAMTFTPPVTATTFTLNIRPHGSTGAYTTTVYSNLTPGQTVTYDATGLRPGSGSNVYDYVYLGTDAGGNKVSSGTGTVTVNADGTTNTTIVSDRAPLVLQGPAGEHVPRMEIDLAPHSSGTTPTKIFLTGTWNATLNCSVFSWDVSAWQPTNGSQAAYDYTMTMQNADGSAFKNEIGNPISITGVMTLGASGSSAVSIQQYVNELNVAAQVSHNQTFDAFGEISSEYDDATLQRAQADVALYGGTLDSSAVRTTFLYNTMGELIQKMDPQTSITLANGFRYRAQPVTTYAYDLDGRLTVTTDANGNKTEQNYAGAGDRAHSQWAGDGGEKTTDYDTFGSVAKLTDELGYVTLQKVDKMGNLVEADQLGISRIANASSGPNMVAATLVDTYTYDAFGHRITHANASLAVDKTYYDSLGRVTKTVTDAGRATTYGYTFVPFGAGPGILGNGGVSIGGYQLRTTNADSSFTLDNINYFGVTTWHQDEGGHTFEYDYDVGGHLTHQFSSSSGQNIYYTYYANGDIKQSSDLADHTLTRYGYDNAGNRTWEQYSALNADNVTPGAIFQSSTISYDELDRMMHVSDPSADVQYQYDAVGNRRSVQATYFDPLQGLRQQDNFWYTYDAANRFLITKGSLAGHASSAGDTSASIVQGAQGVIITYDQRGERMSARNADGSQEGYTYTADGYLQDTTINGTLRARRRVDALGRTFEYLEYDTSGVTTTTDQTSLYDADSRLLSQTDAKANSTTKYFYFTDATDNQATAIQAGAGVLAHVDTQPQTGVGTSTIYSYVYWDSAKETGIQVKALGAGTASWASGFSQLQYDDNGYLTAASDIADNRNYAYVNSANGLVLRREETGSAGHFFDYWYYASDRMIGDVSTNAAENAAGRTSYAEELAQSTPGGKVDPTSFKHTAPATSQVATADFDQNYQPINSTYPAATGSTYTVRNGDTLKSIARQVWGDADMWYLIAQANNLGGNETLVAGQVLQIPNKVTNIHNNANTFRPYNPGEVIGHIDPSLPQPPAPAAKSGGGCGTIGTIIMVVVAVVATIYTCGAAAELMGAALAEGATTMSLGASVLMGTAGSALAGGALGATMTGLAAAAIGGAVGSIASQVVGDAMGNTHGFSWKQVATAAIGSAVTAGVGEAFAPAADAVATTEAANGGVTLTTSLERTGIGAAEAVSSSAVGQLLKGEWSWRQIAASAVSSVVGQEAGAAMSSAVGAVTTDAATQAFAQKLGSNLGGAWASQQVLATDPRYTKARTSSLFANALGQAIGDTISDTVIKQGQVDQAAAASERVREANRFAMGASLNATGTDVSPNQFLGNASTSGKSLNVSFGGPRGGGIQLAQETEPPELSPGIPNPYAVTSDAGSMVLPEIVSGGTPAPAAGSPTDTAALQKVLDKSAQTAAKPTSMIVLDGDGNPVPSILSNYDNFQSRGDYVDYLKEVQQAVASGQAISPDDLRTSKSFLFWQFGYAMGAHSGTKDDLVGDLGEINVTDAYKSALNSFVSQDDQTINKRYDFYSNIQDVSDNSRERYVDMARDGRTIRLTWSADFSQLAKDVGVGADEALRKTDFSVYDSVENAAFATSGVRTLQINGAWRPAPADYFEAVHHWPSWVTDTHHPWGPDHVSSLAVDINMLNGQPINNGGYTNHSPSQPESDLIGDFTDNLLNSPNSRQMYQPWRMWNDVNTDYTPNSDVRPDAQGHQVGWPNAVLHRNHIHFAAHG